MTGNETHDPEGIATVETNRTAEWTGAERWAPVLGAYDAVKGTDAFILAAADRDNAWLAVETGGERDLERWR